MEVKTFVWRLFVLLLVTPSVARAAAVETYFTEGGNMALEPKVAGPITNILWKHKGNLLAEWVKDSVALTYYDTFDGRTELTTTTGQLLITKMNKNDTGEYTLEINNIVHSESYTAKMIKEVPQPSVWIQPVACTSKSESCTLLCVGRTPEVTTEAEPVKYSWKDDGKWRSSTGNEFIITKDDTFHMKTFSCRMENPVGMKESAPKENPFYVEEIGTGIDVVGLVIGLLFGSVAALVLAVVGYFKRHAIMACVNKNRANTNPDTNGSPRTDDVAVPLRGATTDPQK